MEADSSWTVLDTWRMRRFRIGTRLRLVFACILMLMFIGASLSVWYLRAVREDLQRVSKVEERMSAVLQVDNSVLALMNQLHRSADSRDRERFVKDAQQFVSRFRAETANAILVLTTTPAENGRLATEIDTLRGLVRGLPDRVESTVDLARADDWAAVHARLLNQVDRSDDVVASLVANINDDLMAARRQLQFQVGRAQLHSVEALIGAAVLSLTLAGLMGLGLTRSITRPLAALDAAAHALARGEFAGRFTVTGGDELAQVTQAFNHAARQLEDLYGKLRLREARFRSLIENASEMILIAGESGRILYASPSTARILGQPTEQLAGRPLQELLESQDRAAADQMFAELRQRSGRTARLDWRFRHYDGSARMVEGIATNLLNDPAVAGIVINARDVSDRRMAEMALRERDEQLRQAQKMEAMGLLAGGIAHDFNNLLTVINGYADFLVNSLDRADQRRNYAEDVREAGDQAAKLTQQLLAFSRKQVLNSTVLSVNDVVRDTDRMLRRVIGEDIELVCRLDPSIGPVEADRNQLQQVLMNLAVNARDAMPHGGRLTIETGETNTEPPFIMVAVADTGEGMDEATQRRIFDPFFTTKGAGKGTGLGLSTVYGIVSQSGGKITVRSGKAEGTTFLIHLPRTHRAVEPVAHTSLSGDIGGHETILVVEDQADVRSFACRSLQNFGYRVLEASGADDALRIAARDGDSIDLLLTDVVMPGMNGVELSRKLRAQYPRMKVVYASGYADSVMLRHGVTDTGAAFIPKPYGPAVLAKKIREVLGRESSHATG